MSSNLQEMEITLSFQILVYLLLKVEIQSDLSIKIINGKVEKVIFVQRIHLHVNMSRTITNNTASVHSRVRSACKALAQFDQSLFFCMKKV